MEDLNHHMEEGGEEDQKEIFDLAKNKDLTKDEIRNLISTQAGII